MGRSHQEEFATTARPAWAERISRRRATARPRFVLSMARKPRLSNFGPRRVKITLSPTKRKRRSPGAGVIVGVIGSTRDFYHEEGMAQSKRRNEMRQI